MNSLLSGLDRPPSMLLQIIQSKWMWHIYFSFFILFTLTINSLDAFCGEIVGNSGEEICYKNFKNLPQNLTVI